MENTKREVIESRHFQMESLPHSFYIIKEGDRTMYILKNEPKGTMELSKEQYNNHLKHFESNPTSEEWVKKETKREE